MKFDKQKIFQKINKYCHENDGRLLFLTVFGSHLYGTAVDGKSDCDVRGIFLPSLSSLILGTAKHSIHLSTGTDTERNSADDVDIDLCSVQNWLLRQLPAGEIGALDLLFAPSNEACTVFKDSRLDDVFAHPLRFLNTTDEKACSEYCFRQAKKYGIKGSRLGALRTVLAQARKLWPDTACYGRVEEHAESLVKACADDRYCRLDGNEGARFLLLCGKQYSVRLKAGEFVRRVEQEIEKYGQRATLADALAGIDWKAVSHAVRAIRQNEELLRTGNLRFPLACAQELLQIKRGQVSWETCESRILSGLTGLEKLRHSSQYRSDASLQDAQRVILQCYKRQSVQNL